MCTAWRYSSAHFIYAISLYAVKGAKEETSNSIRHTRTEHAEFKQLPLVMHITQDRVWKWVVVILNVMIIPWNTLQKLMHNLHHLKRNGEMRMA